MSRLPDATRATFPESLQYVWDRLAGDQTAGEGQGPANIFRAMGNNPALLRGYLRLGNALWADCGLDVATRELVILRAAILQHSMYEWHQHVRIGQQAGLTARQINALHHWRQSDVFSPSDAPSCSTPTRSPRPTTRRPTCTTNSQPSSRPRPSSG